MMSLLSASFLRFSAILSSEASFFLFFMICLISSSFTVLKRFSKFVLRVAFTRVRHTAHLSSLCSVSKTCVCVYLCVCVCVCPKRLSACAFASTAKKNLLRKYFACIGVCMCLHLSFARAQKKGPLEGLPRHFLGSKIDVRFESMHYDDAWCSQWIL